jgi:hypothetical protein
MMRELAPDKRRKTNIHRRGNFLDQGDPVTPGVPAAFHNLPDGAPLNRLGLAQWLVSRDNPLTPRVWANRIWARLFGIGIVETEEDFGALGSAPSNSDLLDWLAAEYRDNGWSLKKLIKTIVMSDTYRQASEITPALRDADPRNLIQSRGARFRLSAEEVCQIRRIRTNTPLQALVTLNDPVYLEAAAGLARRMIEDAETTTSRAARGLRLALIRPLRNGETAPLIELQKEAQKSFEAAPEKAAALLKSARATEPKGVSKPAFAAWIVTASAILNLDEFLTCD